MIVNSKIKYRSNTLLGLIINLFLDFILYFVTAYEEEPNTFNITSLEEASKKIFMTNKLQQ